MRIILWHGYLLSGTGSNIYTRAIAREWGRVGHVVTVVCQEPDPGRFDLAGARVVRPSLPGGRLPVFVLDRYEELEPRLLQDLTPDERRSYVEANAEAVRALLPADLVFCNHVLAGGAVGAASGARYAVKAHGSELEYSIRGDADLVAEAQAGLERAAVVYVGSRHIRDVLEEVVGHVAGVHEVPPGVDVDVFRPQSREDALRNLLEECRRDPPNPGNAEERRPDEGNADKLGRFLPGDAPTVVYFGKLLYNKGVHLLLEALHGIDARAVIVGFGDYRRRLEGEAPPRTVFTGALEHRHLIHLLPLADAVVVPSIFPEAFGMVAVEAAAAGCPPLVARHSGLAEIAAGLEEVYPEQYRQLASFSTGDSIDLAEKLHDLLALEPRERAELGAAARRLAKERWSWARVAERLLEPFE
jgi:glycosyltransferase involved in cell wall biosynthesis